MILIILKACFYLLGVKKEQRKGEKYGEERLYKASLDARPNQRYWIECPDGSYVIPPGKNFPSKKIHGEKITPTSEDGVWKWTFGRYKEEFEKGNIVFKETSTSSLVNTNNEQSKWNIYNKVWLNDQQNKGMVPGNFISSFENRQSSAELKALNIPFDFAKPVNLIKYLLKISRTRDTDMILDFFAGSGTTAHAVMQLNAEDNGTRKFITAQIDELTDEKSEAYKAGYKTIYEITKARIEKAAQKIAEENPDFKGDLGFKIFETVPEFEGYQDDIENLQDNTTLFDGSTLRDDELDTLLTTWRVHDGMTLTEKLEEIVLGSYKAYYGNGTVYMMSGEFETDDLKAFIKKLDEEKAFEPSKVILFGYNFKSKHQREFKEALSTYLNRKSIELDLVIRY